MPLFSSAPKSICILRLSAIGDVCHAVAMVQSIQRFYPETKITWVIGKIEYELLKNIQGVNFVIYDKKSGIKGLFAFWKTIRKQKFDALLHMQVALRASIVSLGIKSKYKIGFHKSRAKDLQWLFTNQRISDTTTKHVLDSFYSFAEHIGVPKETPQWDLNLPKEASEFVEQLNLSSKVVAISAAASKDQRSWTVEGYSKVADYLTQQGYQVVLCGSPAEREKKLAISIQAQASSELTNLVGQTSLPQLAALLGKVDLVISPDSGPAHIATTQGTPVIGLYGHSNPIRTGPYNSIKYCVSVYEKHASDGKAPKWDTRVKGENIMQDISVKQVTQTIQFIIKTHN